MNLTALFLLIIAALVLWLAVTGRLQPLGDALSGKGATRFKGI